MSSNTASPLFSLNVKDEDNNRVYTEHKGSWLAVMLEMRNKPAKQIAKLTTDSLLIKKDRNKHLFRRNNSYGLNRLLLTNLPSDITTVIISDEKGVYKIPLQTILKDPETINFDLQGYEPQVLVKIDLIEKFKV
jgi:hypothetical protein